MGFHISAPHPGKRYKRIELKPLTSESKFGRLLWSAVSVCSSVKSFTPGEVAGGQWGSSRTLIQSNAVACSQGEISGNLHRCLCQRKYQLWMSAKSGEHQIMAMPAKNPLSCPGLLAWVWDPRNKQSKERRKALYWDCGYYSVLRSLRDQTVSILWEPLDRPDSSPKAKGKKRCCRPAQTCFATGPHHVLLTHTHRICVSPAPLPVPPARCRETSGGTFRWVPCLFHDAAWQREQEKAGFQATSLGLVQLQLQVPGGVIKASAASRHPHRSPVCHHPEPKESAAVRSCACKPSAQNSLLQSCQWKLEGGVLLSTPSVSRWEWSPLGDPHSGWLEAFLHPPDQKRLPCSAPQPAAAVSPSPCFSKLEPTGELWLRSCVPILTVPHSHLRSTANTYGWLGLPRPIATSRLGARLRRGLTSHCRQSQCAGPLTCYSICRSVQSHLAEIPHSLWHVGDSVSYFSVLTQVFSYYYIEINSDLSAIQGRLS